MNANRQRRAVLAAVLTAALLSVLGLVACGGPPTGRPLGPVASASVRVTWLSIANVLVEAGSTRILLNAYFSRIGLGSFSQDGGASRSPRKSDPTPAFRAVAGALGLTHLDYLLTGHSHYDHSFDAAAIANLTGAHIVGSRTACLQAAATGFPSDRCSPVFGGESLALSKGVTVRVVRLNHGGAGVGVAPRELAAVPAVDPATGGLRPGTLEDFPNGGGALGYLFMFNNPGARPATLFFQDVPSQPGFDDPVVSSGVSYGVPAQNLATALDGAGINGVDLWVEAGTKQDAMAVVPILRPRFVVPIHWDSVYAPMTKGVPWTYPNRDLSDYLSRHGVRMLVPCQYLDAWLLDSGGTVRYDVTSRARRSPLRLPDCPFGRR